MEIPGLIRAFHSSASSLICLWIWLLNRTRDLLTCTSNIPVFSNEAQNLKPSGRDAKDFLNATNCRSLWNTEGWTQAFVRIMETGQRQCNETGLKPFLPFWSTITARSIKASVISRCEQWKDHVREVMKDHSPSWYIYWVSDFVATCCTEVPAVLLNADYNRLVDHLFEALTVHQGDLNNCSPSGLISRSLLWSLSSWIMAEVASGLTPTTNLKKSSSHVRRGSYGLQKTKGAHVPPWIFSNIVQEIPSVIARK